MSINLNFTGSANSNYTPPGTAFLYGTMAYNAAGTGIRPVNDNFSQLVDIIAAETTGYSEAVIDFTLATAGAEAGLCFIDGTRSGFSVIITASSITLRNEVSASAGSTIASLSTTNSGSVTYLVSVNLSTGAVVVTKNGTQVLTGTYGGSTSGLRPGIQSYIYDGTGASFVSLVTSTGTGVARTVDSVGSSGVVTLGATGVPITTTGLGNLSTVTISGVAVSALSADGGDGTFTAPSPVDGAALGLLGAGKPLIAGDGTNTASTTVTTAPPTGWSYVTLAGTLNTSQTSLLYQASPAVAIGHQIVGETAKITLYQSLDAETSYVGSQTLWHIDATDGVWRSFTLTTGNAGGGGATATPSGVQAVASVGVVTASGGGKSTPSGVQATASVGTVTASGGAKAAPSSPGMTSTVGTVVGKGGATALVTGVQASALVGTVVAIGNGGGTAGTATPAGVQAAVSLGAVIARGGATAAPASPGLTSFVGSVIARGGAIVAVIGVQARALVGFIGTPPAPEDNSLKLTKSEVRRYDKISPAADRVDLGAILADLDSRLSTLESKVDQLER